jgi:hypothetical protein
MKEQERGKDNAQLFGLNSGWLMAPITAMIARDRDR